MAHENQPPETDLIGVELDSGAGYNPFTVHTHYFGFQIPEAGIGAFTYIRYQPYFPLSQGNVMIFQGADNLAPLDMAHHNWVMTQPWPTVSGNTITTSIGYSIEFTELGKQAVVRYDSGDGACSFEVEQTAISPLCARGSVIPGEDIEGSIEPGGSEQFMHAVGELKLGGETYAIDCKTIRDRSWNQDRTEDRGGRHVWPGSWTPVYFDDDLAFNQVGFEAADSNPAWEGLLPPLPEDDRGFHFGWVSRGGVIRDLVRVRRNVTELHPTLHIPLRQEIEAEDDQGDTYEITGEALACSPLSAWPNAGTYDTVMRWETSDGRVGHGPCQGIWYDDFQLAMKQRRAAESGVSS